MNDNLKWIKYDEFIESNRVIINKYENIDDDNQADNLIEILNNIELEKSYSININKEYDYKEKNNDNSSENEDHDNMSEEEILSDEDNNILKLI